MQLVSKALPRIAQILLDPVDRYGEVKMAVDELYEQLINIAELDENSEIDREHVFLPEGKAIGPIWAAMCLKEFMRTKRFVQGIDKAIRQAKITFPNRPIHILYAGTGPFATLILPLTAVYSSSDIKCTFLEINPESIRALQKVIEAFGIESYIYDIVQCDAAKYKADNARPVHIVVSEVMQNALNKEPQVAVTLNLAAQLASGGIFIPESVQIDAALTKGGNITARSQPYLLGTVFRLQKSTTQKDARQKVFFDFPADAPSDLKQLSLLTKIRVFGEWMLEYGQCSLTLPYKLWNLCQLNTPHKRVCIQYLLSDTPHFLCEFYEN